MCSSTCCALKADPRRASAFNLRPLTVSRVNRNHPRSHSREWGFGEHVNYSCVGCMVVVLEFERACSASSFRPLDSPELVLLHCYGAVRVLENNQPESGAPGVLSWFSSNLCYRVTCVSCVHISLSRCFVVHTCIVACNLSNDSLTAPSLAIAKLGFGRGHNGR